MVAPARHSTRWRMVAAWIAWVAVAVACCGIGYRTVHRNAQQVTPVAAGRSATDDTWLGWLGIPHPTAAIERAAAGVPSDKTIVVIGPSDDGGLGLTYFIISSLSWPRPVALVHCLAGSPVPEIVVNAPGPIGGLIYIRLEDRGGRGFDTTRISPTMRLEHSGAGPGSWCSL